MSARRSDSHTTWSQCDLSTRTLSTGVYSSCVLKSRGNYENAVNPLNHLWALLAALSSRPRLTPRLCGYEHCLLSHLFFICQAPTFVEMSSANATALTASEITKAIKTLPQDEAFKVSDAHHSFGELYNVRAVLIAHMLNMFFLLGIHKPYKSKRHANGDLFNSGKRFVVGAHMPTGQIMFHVNMSEWDLFQVQEIKRAPCWDGHPSALSIVRLEAEARLWKARQGTQVPLDLCISLLCFAVLCLLLCIWLPAPFGLFFILAFFASIAVGVTVVGCLCPSMNSPLVMFAIMDDCSWRRRQSSVH
jgi:hypothetical protein